MTDGVIIHENDMTLLISPRLEGIYTRQGTLKGYEILSQVSCQVTGKKFEPHLFFSTLSEDNLAKILRFQLQFVSEVSGYCRSLCLLICLNMNVTTLRLLLNDSQLMATVFGLRDFLRIEIDEDIQLQRNESVLLAVRELCPIWLDDFGRGEYFQQKNCIKYFEVIKIDRRFIHVVTALSSGKRLLMEMVNNLRREGAEVLAEGVENMSILHKLHTAGFDAFQGWYWKEEFITADQFPQLKLHGRNEP